MTMSYIDEDEDLIQLTSSDELEDAVGQFLQKDSVKIYVDVQRRERVSRNELKSLASASSGDVITYDSQASPSNYQEATQSTNLQDRIPNTSVREIHDLKNQRQIDIMAGALAALKIPAAVPPRPPESDVCHRLVTGVPLEICIDNGSSQCAENSTIYNSLDDLESLPPPTRNIERDRPENEKASSRSPPFVHFRHICDHCKASPIIGKRFRSNLRSNFDLCEQCFLEHPLHSNDFHAAEDELDRKYQAALRGRYLSPTEEEKNVEDHKSYPEVPINMGNDNSNGEEDPPFIHGRHRCNGCSISPIGMLKEK